MKKKLLFIEDELDYALIVAKYLTGEGWSVKHEETADAGLSSFREKKFTAILLDLNLPDIYGLKVCEVIRSQSEIPIFILSAKDEVEDKVKLLNLGADDYLSKPASLKELNVRLERLLKRDLEGTHRSSIIKLEDCNFNVFEQTLSRDMRRVSLSRKENDILEYLVLNKGQALTRLDIMGHVWGDDIDMFSNIVNVTISSLRKKMRRLGKQDLINSVHGIGYKYE